MVLKPAQGWDVWKHFGNADTRGYQTPVPWLGKDTKPAFMMVTDFAKDYLIPEEAQPGYEKCRPQSQVD